MKGEDGTTMGGGGGPPGGIITAGLPLGTDEPLPVVWPDDPLPPCRVASKTNNTKS